MNYDLSDSKERIGQLLDEKASVEEKLKKNKLHLDSAQ
jgi:hypothetical protein